MKYAEYIKQIEIDSLWSGKRHVVWNLDRQVNILSGINGVGKSSLANWYFAENLTRVGIDYRNIEMFGNLQT